MLNNNLHAFSKTKGNVFVIKKFDFALIKKNFYLRKIKIYITNHQPTNASLTAKMGKWNFALLLIQISKQIHSILLILKKILNRTSTL